VHDVNVVDHVLAVLFERDLFFANSGVFRRDIYTLVKKYPTPSTS